VTGSIPRWAKGREGRLPATLGPAQNSIHKCFAFVREKSLKLELFLFPRFSRQAVPVTTKRILLVMKFSEHLASPLLGKFAKSFKPTAHVFAVLGRHFFQSLNSFTHQAQLFGGSVKQAPEHLELFALALEQRQSGMLSSMIPRLATLDYRKNFRRWMGGIWFLGCKLRQKYKRLRKDSSRK